MLNRFIYLTNLYNSEINKFINLKIIIIIKKKIKWDVEEMKIFNKNGNPIPGYKQLSRSDNGNLLNVCKESYTPMPNEIFEESVEKLSEITGYKIKEYHDLVGGNIILAYLDASIVKWNGEKVQRFMVVGNSHNGKSAFFIGEHTVMIRCENQFNLIRQGLKVYHTQNYQVNTNSLMTNINEFKKLTKSTDKKMLDFARVKITPQMIDAGIKYLLQLPQNETQKTISTRKRNIWGEMESAINKETKALGRNLFGFFNGVTYYTSNIRKVKDSNYNSYFGSNARLNNHAIEYCETVMQ